MASNEIHVNDVGLVFESTVLDENSHPIDLSGAQVIQFTFEKPDKTQLVVPGTLSTDGKDGVVRYVTALGDLNLAGTYRYQLYFEIGPDAKHSDIGKFKVITNL